MLEHRSGRFQRFAAVAAILSAPFSYILTVTLLQAVSFDFTVLGTPAEFIAIGSAGATIFKWTMLGDIFGQYLLLLPLVLFLWYWLSPHEPLMVTLVTIGGVLYIFFGALGVSINAAVLPDLMRQYTGAGAEQQLILETVFGAFANAIIVGAWGIFTRLVGGLYWIGIGWILQRERRRIGYFSVFVGLLALVSVVGNVLQVGPLIGVGTMGYLLGFPLWALWLGIVLYRNPSMRPVETADVI